MTQSFRSITGCTFRVAAAGGACAGHPTGLRSPSGASTTKWSYKTKRLLQPAVGIVGRLNEAMRGLNGVSPVSRHGETPNTQPADGRCVGGLDRRKPVIRRVGEVPYSISVVFLRFRTFRHYLRITIGLAPFGGPGALMTEADVASINIDARLGRRWGGRSSSAKGICPF